MYHIIDLYITHDSEYGNHVTFNYFDYNYNLLSYSYFDDDDDIDKVLKNICVILEELKKED